jgi:hypothetical protein
MDRQPPFFSPMSCVRCGAFFQLVRPDVPCPHCGLPARFSLPWQGAAPLPIAPISGPEVSAAASPAASASRIPVIPAVESEAPFSGDELRSLLRLRERYQKGDAAVRDGEFSDEERARLGFMRWLYRSGRLVA